MLCREQFIFAAFVGAEDVLYVFSLLSLYASLPLYMRVSYGSDDDDWVFFRHSFAFAIE